MLGISLLLLAIYQYAYGRKRWSLLLFFIFMTNGLRILTNEILGVKNADLAFVYTIIICIYSFFREHQPIKYENKTIRKLVGGLFVFLICSALFSLLYYEFTPWQILQGGRQMFLFISYYFLRKTNRSDLYWIIKVLYYITLIHSGLYIMEVLTQIPVLPYGEAIVDPLTGVARYYNSPVFLNFYLFILCIFPDIMQVRYKKITIPVLLAALFCTQGRTYITITLGFLFIGLLLKGQTSKAIRTGLIVGICLLPFSDMLLSRFGGEKGANKGEFHTLISGDFIKYARAGIFPEGTMAYRFAWVAERVIYLNNRPLSENIFGLGMISDSQPIVLRKYKFNLGLTDPNTDAPSQLGTPDIAYGNLITRFGYVGGIMVLWLWLYTALFLYRNRKLHPIIFVYALVATQMIFGAFSGDTIANMGNLVMPFFVISLVYDLKVQTRRKALNE